MDVLIDLGLWNSWPMSYNKRENIYLSGLEQRLNYFFKNRDLLKKALTHRSHGLNNNERLEFLGDSVLNLATTVFIFHQRTGFNEGGLHRLRAKLVCEKTLYQIAINLNLQDYIILSQGEEKSGGKLRPSILADTLEALLGAIYIDSNISEVDKVIKVIFAPILDKIDINEPGKDPKSELQELLQSKKLLTPQYKVMSKTGVEHNQTFRVKCFIPELKISSYGIGNSRKEAEICSAKKIIKDVKTELKLSL